MQILLDHQHQVYRVTLGDDNFKVSHSFEDVYAQAVEMSIRLALMDIIAPTPMRSMYGTEAQYRQFLEIREAYRTVNDQATWYDARTKHAIRDVLEHAIQTGECLRIFYGDPVTGRDCLMDTDTIGFIRRSNDAQKMPTLHVDSTEHGSVMFTHLIVKVVSLRTGATLYCQENYHLPEIKLEALSAEEQVIGHCYEAIAYDVQGKRHLIPPFPSAGHAHMWLKFITGITHTKTPTT